jgi:hypothetical protein
MKNNKVVVMSILGLICLGLVYFVSWWFIIPAAIFMTLNHRELIKKK